MIQSVRPGVYPTMITPYTDDNRVDLEAAAALVDFYAQNGCDGVFALCQSSEIFFLSDEEKRALMRAVAGANKGRMQLVASAHTAWDIQTQIRQLASMAENGADACVIILNRAAAQDEGEDVVRRNIEALLEALPDLSFGVYECPYPYKRMASTELLRWLARTGRVLFFKDTCCLAGLLAERQEAVAGTPLKLFNANTATLLDSLRQGIVGYSGVMANVHPDLYAALFRLHRAGSPDADGLQGFLTMASWVENRCYPVCAKYYHREFGVPMTLRSRVVQRSAWNATLEAEVRALRGWEERVRQWLGR